MAKFGLSQSIRRVEDPRAGVEGRGGGCSVHGAGYVYRLDGSSTVQPVKLLREHAPQLPVLSAAKTF